jgi:hypothetical protein
MENRAETLTGEIALRCGSCKERIEEYDSREGRREQSFGTL